MKNGLQINTTELGYDLSLSIPCKHLKTGKTFYKMCCDNCLDFTNRYIPKNMIIYTDRKLVFVREEKEFNRDFELIAIQG